MKKKRKLRASIEADVTSPITAAHPRQMREKLTHVEAPIRTNISKAKQWSRWTP